MCTGQLRERLRCNSPRRRRRRIRDVCRSYVVPVWRRPGAQHRRTGPAARSLYPGVRNCGTSSHPRGRTIGRDSRGRRRGGLARVASRREVVVGAVTRPWEANVIFRALPPEQFAAFHEPGYVKIVWTIRADPITATESVFRTETRAIATDANARARFRRYWSFVSPGIIAIRWAILGPVKKEAERRAREALSHENQIEHDSR